MEPRAITGMHWTRRYFNETVSLVDSSVEASFCTIIATGSQIVGNGNYVSGHKLVVSGQNNILHCSDSLVFGSNNVVRGRNNQSGKDENAKEGEPRCVLCLEKKSVMAIVPCGHLCLCMGCSIHGRRYLRNKCPICCQGVRSVIKVYSA